MRIIFYILGAAGLSISAYFTGVYYEWLSPRAGPAAEFCGIDEKGCQSVIRTSAARILGVPNSLLGIVFYAMTIGLAAAGLPAPALRIYVLLCWIAVTFGIYLSYALLFVLRTPCRLCFVAHAINLTLAIMASAAA